MDTSFDTDRSLWTGVRKWSRVKLFRTTTSSDGNITGVPAFLHLNLMTASVVTCRCNGNEENRTTLAERENSLCLKHSTPVGLGSLCTSNPHRETEVATARPNVGVPTLLRSCVDKQVLIHDTLVHHPSIIFSRALYALLVSGAINAATVRSSARSNLLIGGDSLFANNYCGGTGGEYTMRLGTSS